MKPQKSYLKLLLIILGIVIIASGLVYYFGVVKASKTTLFPSPSPAKSIPISPSASKTANPDSTITSTPESNKTSSNNQNNNETANPNLTSFSFNPTDSLWPNAITITFDSLGKAFDQNSLQLKDGNKTLLSFGPDMSYYPSTDPSSAALADAEANRRVKMSEGFSYDRAYSYNVSGLGAAYYNWNTDSGRGRTIIVLIYPGVGQKALAITGFFSNISGSDFNKIVESIVIKK